jgi:hypothetical protein
MLSGRTVECLKMEERHVKHVTGWQSKKGWPTSINGHSARDRGWVTERHVKSSRYLECFMVEHIVTSRSMCLRNKLAPSLCNFPRHFKSRGMCLQRNRETYWKAVSVIQSNLSVCRGPLST